MYVSGPLRHIFERRWKRSAEGSLLFAIQSALKIVRFGSRDDESIAFEANKIVRRELDKHAITYTDYRAWRAHNPFVFTSVVDEDNNLIGFFDIFPLTSAAGAAVISGALTERSLTLNHIVPPERMISATHLHLATILRSPHQKRFSPLVASEVILLKMKEFLENHYEPLVRRTYLAFAQSREGEALLKRCGFSMILMPDQNDQHFPLYMLPPSDAVNAIDRFERTGELFSSRSNLNMLNSRLEHVELQLRRLIVSTVGDDPRQLPGNVDQPAKTRIADEARRNPAFDLRRYRSLSARLEFYDLRELEGLITNTLLWPKFSNRFAKRETLAIKFGQIAALRNAIRHSRHVDDIACKEGEAGILWFERMLGNPVKATQRTTEDSI